MLLQQVLQDLRVELQAFAVCEVADGWRLQLAGQGWVTVHFVLSGEGRLRMGPRVIPLAAQSLVLVPRARVHSIEAGEPVDHEVALDHANARIGDLELLQIGPRGPERLTVVCAHIRAVYDNGLGLFDRLDEPVSLDFSESPEMAAAFERLLAEETQRSATSDVMMTALMNEVLILLFRRLCAEPDCPLPWLSALEDPRFLSVISSMIEHPERPHSVESLAATALMSRSAFAVGFSERFGRSPMAYLRAARMRRAAQLLRSTDLTVGQVAARVGYASRSQFSRAFVAVLGDTPTAFRREPGPEGR